MALAVTSAIWQQVNSPALDIRRFISAGMQEGVVGVNDMAVAQRGAGANFTVDIPAGEALVRGDTVTNQALYYAYNDATFNLTGFTAAHATLPRIDRVTLRVRDAFHGDAANDASFQIVTGTATSGATLVNLTGVGAVPTSSLLLANILIPATATTITTANIDTTVRTSSSLAPPDGSVTNAKVAAAAGIVGSKLSNVPYVYDRVTTGVDVQTSTTETSIYTKSITGNDMGTNRMLRLIVLGDYLHNNVAGDTLTLRIKFGGTTFYAKSADFNTSVGAARHPYRLDLRVANVGATNSQMIEGSLPVEFASASAPTTGIGAWASPSNPLLISDLGIGTLGTIDTTTAQTLDVTVQWSASSANNSWRMRYAVLELV